MSAMLPGRHRPGNHRSGRHSGSQSGSQSGSHRASRRSGTRRLGWQQVSVLVAVVALVPVAGSVGRAVAHRPDAAAPHRATPVASPPPAPDAPPLPTSVVPPPPPSSSARGVTATTRPAATRSGPALTGPGVRPGEQPPTPDPAVTTQTLAGASAAAVFFIRAVDWSLATGDPFLIEQAGQHGCRACASYIGQLTALRDAGATLRGGRWTITQVIRVQGSSTIKSDYVFRVVIDEAAATVEAPGAAPTRLPARSGVSTYVFVSWVGQRWVVVDQTA